jgi:serine protease Do
MRGLRILFLVLLALGGAAQAETVPAASSAKAAEGSSASLAERLYAAARPKLLKISSLVATAGQQSAIGSGFLVSPDGLAVTNYHVVAQVALDPATYRLEYTAADSSSGGATLLAIDVPDDLAVLRIDKTDAPFFEFDPRALDGALASGEQLYSMGNPLDLGFTVVEGTYNGPVARSYNERIHFTGAVNPGMSGGPTIAADGRVVGINVSKQSGGELVSFLVPARFAAALVKRAQDTPPLSPEKARAEIGAQIAAWQAGLYKSLDDQGFKSIGLGPYHAVQSAAPWFTCWARTSADEVPKPRASIDSTSCFSDTRLFVANDLNVGAIQLTYSYLKSVDLNRFQFANFLAQQSAPAAFGGWGRKWYTPQRCHEDFVAAEGDRPPLRTVWCARAYRAFADLYDVSATMTTENSASEAFVTRLTLQGVGYDNALAVARRFLEALQWTR